MRDENKYERIVSFAEALPKIRRRVSKDLSLSGLPRNKVLATIVQLLEDSFIRVGNEEYARENKSFGLTTMQDRHVEVQGAKLRFRFRGKGGIKHDVDVTDRRIARIVAKLQDLPGQELFQYIDEEGELRDVTDETHLDDYQSDTRHRNIGAIRIVRHLGAEQRQLRRQHPDDAMHHQQSRRVAKFGQLE